MRPVKRQAEDMLRLGHVQLAPVGVQGAPATQVPLRIMVRSMCPLRLRAVSALADRSWSGTAGTGGAVKARPGRAVLCRCGHERLAHEHYRQGAECALCDCPRWSPRILPRGAAPRFLRGLFRKQKP